MEEQMFPILKELGSSDEVVIVDDASPDDTVRVIEAISGQRIRLVRAAENKGYVRTFEEAIGHSRGKYIFLADQDDVWIPGRWEKMLEALDAHQVGASNFQILDGGPHPWIPQNLDPPKFLRFRTAVRESLGDSYRIPNLLRLRHGVPTGCWPIVHSDPGICARIP